MDPTFVAGDRLSAADVYAVWQVRDLVFAVEQRCDEPDVDGLDLLAGTTHGWFADDAGLSSYLRTFVATDGIRRIGRVCTRRDARGRGLSGRLITAVHDRWGDDELRLGAQAYLEQWYAGFGYTRCGDPYVEAGIDHVPMRRPGTS
ncbi:hypothetical protein HMPREF0063_12331 [Aeromicrobium marinum DSM 15272]|uniref:N-acetyltransferase domain-containing protein n=1 Tax=Aeromicrobium marinum DSM 15272 TaxID=585531 RepID=E2SD19_9ACTN|nr:GNAT family N-acetyltransferase [Aeromicrobium marinum]EFQ83122.1 hypothetical protein HMPREF0063_12331 [Aeromicrobium marinum DSM 15272]